jgi:effector-binding domain-containing protein
MDRLEQLPRLNRILALKALGLSLEEIARLLDDNLSAEQIRGMFLLKRSELEGRVREEQARLHYVELKLKQIEMEGKMSEYDVVIKSVEPARVVSLRTKAPSQAELSKTFERIFNQVIGHMHQHGAKMQASPLALYHDEEYPETNIDVEAVVPIDNEIPASAEVQVYTLPGYEQVASLVYKGSYDGLESVYQYLTRWINDSGYQFVGAPREVYIHQDHANPANHVTEIQFPVAKG